MLTCIKNNNKKHFLGDQGKVFIFFRIRNRPTEYLEVYFNMMPVSSVEIKCTIRCCYSLHSLSPPSITSAFVIDELNKCIGKMSHIVFIQAALIVSDGFDLFIRKLYF